MELCILNIKYTQYNYTCHDEGDGGIVLFGKLFLKEYPPPDDRGHTVGGDDGFIWYNEFKNAVVVMGKHPKMVFRAFIESGVSLLFIYATVPAYFTGLNIDFDLGQVMGRWIFN